MTAAGNKRLLPRNLDGLFVLISISWLIGFLLIFSGEMAKRDFFGKYRLDFAKFYSQAKLMVSPDRKQLYDTQTQYKWLSANCPNMPVLGPKDTALMFAISSEQPPPFFLLFTPFIALSMHAAFVVAMSLFAALSCFAAVKLNQCRQEKLSREQLIVTLIGAFGSGPAVAGILQGHTNWLITGLAGLFCAFYLKQSDLLAGLMLGCFVIKPQYGIFLVLPALFERRWKVVGVATATAAVLLASCALVAGPECILNYPSVIMSNDVSGGATADQASLLVRTPPQRMITLRGFLSTMLPQRLATIIGAGGMLILMAIIGAMWLKVKNGKGSRLWAMAITVMASIVVGLHNLFYDCSLLLIAAVLTLPTLSLLNGFKLPSLSSKIWTVGLLLFPLTTSIAYIVLVTDPPKTRTLFLYILVLFIAACHQFWLSTKTSRVTQETKTP